MEESIRNAFMLTGRKIETYSPLSLAYIGDCFYELVIRTNLVEQAESSAKVNTRRGTFLASAVTQAAMMMSILPELSEEETAVYKRGRNANTTHGSKGASAGQYRQATGFEALMGYLYLTGKEKRAFELIKLAWEQIPEK